MINAWEYAYDNYAGEDSEGSIVDSIVEQIAEEACDTCDMNEASSEAKRLYENLCSSIREVVTYSLNFNEIKDQIENDRDEYFEREKARRGEY